MLTQKEDLINVEMHSAHFIPQHKEKLFSDEMSSLLWHGKVLPFFPWNLQISFHQLSNLHYVLLWMKHSSLVMVWHQVHSDFSLSVRTLRPQKRCATFGKQVMSYALTEQLLRYKLITYLCRFELEFSSFRRLKFVIGSNRLRFQKNLMICTCFLPVTSIGFIMQKLS